MGFSFCGVHSDSFGVLVKTRRPPTLSSPRIVREEIPGRDGTMKFYLGQQDVIGEVEISVKGAIAERQDKVQSLFEWLRGSGPLRLDFMPSAVTATVTRLESADFGDFHEVIRVTFEAGEMLGITQSAYQIWLSKHSGTIEEFLTWLKGAI